jgi:hypothetical protein
MTTALRRATIDTNVFPAEALMARAREAGIEVVAVSVSAREVRGSSLEEEVAEIAVLLESAVWSESTWDNAVWPSEDDEADLEKALQILSNGSFPPRDRRAKLPPGQLRQLRDAMILCAHVRARRDVLVSNDAKAYIKAGRREALEAAFTTRVMTVVEFEVHVDRLRKIAR